MESNSESLAVASPGIAPPVTWYVPIITVLTDFKLILNSFYVLKMTHLFAGRAINLIQLFLILKKYHFRRIA